MRKYLNLRSILLYAIFCTAILSALAFAIVYQEFGPIDQEKLVLLHLRRPDLVADFTYPKGSTDLPLIIAVGGSGGGFLPEKEMQSLALHGYAVLCVAYFNVAGLPGKLENIPLEYFIHAIEWGSQQPVVDSAKVIILGVSRGAELGLLLASISSQVKGVIAYAPGCFVLPNAVDTEDSIASQSSWTWEGKPLAFAPLKVLEDDHREVINYRNYVEPLLKGVETDDYIIKVENARAPILFLSGEDDQTWPSAQMADLLEKRLKDRGFSYDIKNVSFRHASHWLVQFQNNYQIISSTFFRVAELNVKGKRYRFNNGGSAWGTMIARRKARKETLEFLQRFK